MLRGLDDGLIEHTVTAMPFSGPAVLLATAARTVLVDEQATGDYLERLRRSGQWIDQQTERLRIGAGKGRLPVAPLVREAIEWAERVAACLPRERLEISIDVLGTTERRFRFAAYSAAYELALERLRGRVGHAVVVHQREVDEVRVPVQARFSLADTAAAYQRFAAGSKFGKIVVTMD